MKLYIGGISPEVKDSDLLELYNQFGKVTKIDLLKDPETGLNRGYAFVEIDVDDGGEAAILGTNNTLLGENNIQVSISRSRLDQKIERQKKMQESRRFAKSNNSSVPNKEGKKDKHVFTQRNNNRNRNPRTEVNADGQQDNRFNRFQNNNPRDNRFQRQGANTNQRYNSNDYNRPNSIKKGIDYGRNSSPTQTSFLGREGFANSTRTLDPVYNNNGNRRTYNGKKQFPIRNNKFNGNELNEPSKKNDSSNSLYSPNTSDILGNLENI